MACNVSDIGSKMADALSCPICFLPYDQESRLPKVFPCQHTVCLQCAIELCRRQYDGVFPCPTCRQSVTVPSRGGPGLQTNLDVRNMVEIVQGTDMTPYPCCTQHFSKPVSHVCMECKVGLCSKCISSPAMRDHASHHVMDIDDAFQEIKKTCSGLLERGQDVIKLFTERATEINACDVSLRAALQSNDIAVFGRMGEFAELLDKYMAIGNIRSPSRIDITAKDRRDANIVTFTEQVLKDEMTELTYHCGSGNPQSVTCAKLAAVTGLIDTLRLKLHNKQSNDLCKLLDTLWTMSDESEICCHRVILLDGHSLLLSCLQRYKSNDDITFCTLSTIGNLAEHHSIQDKLLSAEMVNCLIFIIKSYTMRQRQLPENACRSLSLFLSNPSLKWPCDCPSRTETSELVMQTCKSLDVSEPLQGCYTSFKPFLSLLSQQFSEVAKYWPIWTLYRCIKQEPLKYSPMLVSDGGIPVLQQLENAHDYVKYLARDILVGYT